MYVSGETGHADYPVLVAALPGPGIRTGSAREAKGRNDGRQQADVTQFTTTTTGGLTGLMRERRRWSCCLPVPAVSRSATHGTPLKAPW